MGKGSDLFDDVLENDLGGRPVSAKQRIGGAELRADEFAPPRVPDELDARLGLLRVEQEAMLARQETGSVRRVRWTGALWLLAAAALVGSSGLGWVALQRFEAKSRRAAMAHADAARRKADEERLLRIPQVAPVVKRP
ncbi:MAG: hypothetical protein ACYDCL_01110 [Myxococcales bacterium]